MDKVVIFGNQSVAREAFYYLKYDSDHEITGFTVDREFLHDDHFLDLPVVPFDAVVSVFPPHEHKMIIAVGYINNNKIRKDRYFQAIRMGYQLLSFISPKSVVYPGTLQGKNCIIGHCTVISNGTQIGNNVIIGSGCTIGHDVILEDHCFLSNGVSISGRVRIGECCYLGTNAILRNKITVGKECVIGAGAILLENAEDRSVYLGQPATLLPIPSDKLPLG